MELKTGAAVPAKIGDVIGALMSENGAFKFCDTTTTSGRDYRRGIHSLFEGIMAAYRNPAAHANLQYEKREAIEQIMLASQLMCSTSSLVIMSSHTYNPLDSAARFGIIIKRLLPTEPC